MMEQVVTQYLKSLKIPISRTYCERLIRSHPDYPSLLSISDTLEQLGIPHGVARMDRTGLDNLTFPYVIHWENGAGEFIVVKGENDLKEKTDFPVDWNGVVLKAKAMDRVNDAENQRSLSAEKAGRVGKSLFVAASLGLLILLLLPGFSWPAFFLISTAVAGTVLGYLLVAKELGVTFNPVESFCNAGQRVNCDRVLRSDEAKLFGGLSLSDAVLSYFATQLIVAGLLIPMAWSAAPMWWALATAGALTLPQVVYSLWLQALKFKTWCRLCLLVAGVLMVQAGLFGWMAASGVFDLTDGNLWTTGLVTSLFLATGSLVFLLKTHLKEGAEAEQAEAAANRVKYNPSVFTHLLLQQPQTDCAPFEQELLIGKPEAPVNLTMAASLGCSPCKDGLETAKQLVRRFPGIVNLSVRLTVPENGNGQEPSPGRYFLWYWMKQVYNTNDQTEQTENYYRIGLNWPT